MTDPFVERITRTRTDKGETVSGRIREVSGRRFQESEVLRRAKSYARSGGYPDQAMNENQEIHGPEARDRRLASESTPVEQGQDFATSTGTLYREEMS